MTFPERKIEMWKVVLLAVFAVALMAGPSPVSRASAAGGEVKVSVGGDSIPIRLDDLGPPDIPDSSYKLERGWVVYGGYSLRALLEEAARRADFQLVSVVSVDIDAKPGTREIARSQFDNGPPIFFGEEGGTSWILPGSAGQPGQLFAFKGSVPVIRVTYGLEFQVRLSASPAKANAKDEVRLKARVTGQQTGEKLTFSWNFGDGTIREETRGQVSHRFKAQGSYQVKLEVTAPSGGGSARTTVQVGKAMKPKKAKPPGDKKKKVGAEGGKKDDTGAGTGTGNGSGTGTGTGTGTGSGTGSGDGTGSATTFGTTGTAPPGSASGPAPGDHERTEPEQPALRQDDQGLVQGTLVDPADFAPKPVPAQAGVQPTLEEADEGGSGIAGPVLSTTGILILLALGGSAELLVFRRA